ncbi:MAG: HAMP domain-containing sensor histidine kinase [Puia sp.]|nr:HAMP domain-containing sensor histidine kinase [Puia sp.]
MKLFARYSRINLMVMVGIFLLSGVVFYWLVNLVLIREMDADLVGVEERIRNYVGQHDSFPQAFSLDEARISYRTTDRRTAVRQFERITLYSDREKKMHNFRQLTFYMPCRGDWYEVTIVKPLEGLHHLSRVILIVSLSAIFVIIISSILINRVVLSRLWRPFYDTIHAISNFKLGSTSSIRFPETRIEEFAFMNESLKQATEKAEKDYHLLKEFTENASHELQTPLSIIRAKLDLLIQDDGLSQKQSEITRSAYGAVRKLSRLNQSLLLLAKIENRQFSNIETINLQEKIEEKVAQFQELWQSRGISIAYNLQKTDIRANGELIDVLLNNLLSNASNHNLSEGSIGIELVPNQLVVSNTGLDIPLDSNRLYQRFYKGAQHTSRNGLGLSIVKQICEVSSIATVYQFTGSRHTFTLTW